MRDEQNSEYTNENVIHEDVNVVEDRTSNDMMFSTKEVAVTEYRYAGFWMRLWAFLLDLLIIWSIGAIVIFPIFRLLGISTSQSFMFSPATIATTIVLYGYFILMTKYFKQTLGKMVFGLRVVDLKANDLSWKTILFREGVGRYIALVYAPITYIVFLVAAFTSKKQGVHDFIADTTVVHEK
ncbi:RDD family protein [Sutcliffiella horikoshii]|uniref:RDD family protein n=1 Tax=Sutcliffiella horikoshii TaxID=79883 RepID=UPI0038513A14